MGRAGTSALWNEDAHGAPYAGRGPRGDLSGRALPVPRLEHLFLQRTLDKIEEDGLVATRPLVVRAVTLNPLYPAVKELRALLLRLAEGYPEYQRIKESRRLRPRRRNKRL